MSRSTSQFDDDAGPLVRLYAVARGRTHGARPDLDMITMVLSVHEVGRVRRSEREYLEIIRLCRTPHSVAEVAALLHLPLTLAKILIGDLLADGHLITRPVAVSRPAETPELDLLRMVLDGIRSL
ncbi:DUF742 domain-containing protein [Nocardia sp. NPDC057663]|uniref:DUF742 domain-containing protein n=1 Tax=Nocardia sp. NPDC057663 TaxID=3346201 RepID=UPI00366ABD60